METPVFPNGCHICEIEIDPGSGAYDVVRYTTVDDVGLAINPLIVDGQTHGGIVQGAGEALGELCAMDPDQDSHWPALLWIITCRERTNIRHS